MVFQQQVHDVSAGELPQPAIHWRNLIFLSSTHLATFVGIPAYLLFGGTVTWFDLVLMLGFYALSCLGITVGYHRLFAHQSFKTTAWMEFLALFFGASAFQMSALDWASQHRDHHRYVDTDRDPYSIKKGFFYAHMGWLLFWKHQVGHANARDLQRKPWVRHQHVHYFAWSLLAGVALPLLLGAVAGRFWQALLFGCAARIVISYQVTFSINSICHVFGKMTYSRSSAKDHWFVALLTFGEGFHNYHHRFPRDYRNGLRWYHWDPSKWLIALCSRMGLAHDLKRVSAVRILKEQLRFENVEAQTKLAHLGQWLGCETVGDRLELYHRELNRLLERWELHMVACRDHVRSRQKRALQQARQEVAEAQKSFHEVRQAWEEALTALADLQRLQRRLLPLLR